jgi:hypothetical protein
MQRAKTLVAIALALFGTTFLWFMPSFLGTTREPTGGLWPALQLVVVLTILAFGAAGWGLHGSAPWWPLAAAAGAVLGLAVSALWLVALRSLSGVDNVATNVVLHVAGAAAILVVLGVPRRRRTVERLLSGSTSWTTARR